VSFKAWRRVPEPKACDFCLMLASRGAVYHTAATAGDGNDYHRHCRCDAVLETDFDAREDVWISPEDANRKIAFHNRRTNRTYRYDLRQFKVRNPPDVPVQAPVPPLDYPALSDQALQILVNLNVPKALEEQARRAA
jgi:hypothetical protein